MKTCSWTDDDIFKALEQKACQEQADGHGQANDQGQKDWRIVFEENEGYLFSDYWPFIIIHFGEKGEKKAPLDILKTSLTTLIDSFQAEEERGYQQGKNAYRAWIKGLLKEDDFQLENDRENVLRRLDVNDSMLCHLIDSRRSAAAWLRENIPLAKEKGGELLAKIAENFQAVSDMMSAFRSKVYRSSMTELCKEQAGLLERALILEEENCRLAGLVLETF